MIHIIKLGYFDYYGCWYCQLSVIHLTLWILKLFILNVNKLCITLVMNRPRQRGPDENCYHYYIMRTKGIKEILSVP